MADGIIKSDNSVVNQAAGEIEGKSLLEREFYSGYPKRTTISGIREVSSTFSETQSVKTCIASAMQKETAMLREIGIKFASIDKIDQAIE